MLDGHLTNTKLAKKIGLSESATLERVRRLEASNIIEGYTIQVNPAKVGRMLEVYMTFMLKNQSIEDIQRFEDALAQMDEVLSCEQVMGRFDFLAHVAVKDIESLQHFINQRLIPLGVIDRMESLTVLKMRKRSHPPLPIS